MSRINLQFTICGQRIQRKDNTPLAANSVGFTGAFFTFDSSWNGLVKTAVFESISGSSYDVLLGTQNECDCTVASEVLSLTGNGGKFYVSVKGTELDGDTLVTRATANKVELFFEESCSLSGANVGTPTPTVPEQVISALAKSQWLTGTAVTGTGTGISATIENAAVGCHYLNTSTGNYYLCTAVTSPASTWNYVGCLKGEHGAQGVAGKDLMPVSTHSEFADWKRGIANSYRAVAIACDDFDAYSEGDVICVDKDALGNATITSYSIIGEDGADGVDGEDGTDGITPHIDSTSKHWMIGTTDTGIVAEGQNGTNGTDGQDGRNGTDGTDGFSPAVTISEITGGHRVTITDEAHPQGQSFDVTDGEDGVAYTAGTGISIEENVISAVDKTGTVYVFTHVSELPNPDDDERLYAGDGAIVLEDETNGNNISVYALRYVGGLVMEWQRRKTLAPLTAVTQNITLATSDWSATSSKAPYTYSATAQILTPLTANSEVELINDNAVLFANHGFAIDSISSQIATFVSIGKPSESVSLKVVIK